MIIRRRHTAKPLEGYDLRRVRKSSRVVSRSGGPPFGRTMSFALDQPTYAAIHLEAHNRGISAAALIRALIVAYLARIGGEHPA